MGRLFGGMNFCAATMVAAILLAGAPSRSYADTGSVRIKFTKVGLIVGAAGTASNLRFAADIAGTYSAVSTGIAVAAGAKAAVLRNVNGVVLQLQGKQVGPEASISVAGLTISLK